MSGIRPEGYILGIDPGKAKCGVAVLSAHGECITRRIVPQDELEQLVTQLIAQYPPAVVVIGDRTGSKEVRGLLSALLAAEEKMQAIPLKEVPEHYSSVEARRRYLQEHRKGWRKFIPLGLQTPDRPFDDYTAEVLARRYLATRGAEPV